MTLHRPSNVDDPIALKGLVSAIAGVAREVPILFSSHPRTRKHLENQAELQALLSLEAAKSPTQGIHCMEPLGYLDESVDGPVAVQDRPSSQGCPFHAKPFGVASSLVGWTGRAEDCTHSIRASSLRDACHATHAVSS